MNKAKVVTEAFHWLSQFKGNTVVIKLGGSTLTKPGIMQSVATDVLILKQMGLNIILVHGGGPFIDAEMKKQGIKKQTINGLRVTDKTTLLIVQTVFNDINKKIVSKLGNFGIGITHIAKTQLIPDNGYVGEMMDINSVELRSHMISGKTPVVSPLGKTSSGQITNINADTVASAIAIELNAAKLTILTDVDGIKIKNKFVSHLTIKETKNYMQEGQINNGMVPKAKACINAVINGVKKAHLINGSIPQALLLEIFTDKGIGTEIINGTN